jgi:peptidyl-prolyl cis-trans isomerase C
MKELMKYLVLLLAAVSLRGLAATPAPSASTNSAATTSKPAAKVSDLFPDTVVAKGKGLEIKRSDLDEEIIRAKTAFAAGQRPPPPDLDQRVLDAMIANKLILAQATEADKAKGKEQFEKTFQGYKTENKVTDAEFNEKLAPQLKLQGMTREQWDKQQIEQATMPITLEREMKITITDEEIKKHYDENPARFEEPEMVRASHILLSTRDMTTNKELPDDKKKEKRKQMEDLLKRARAGEDFAKLAQEYSEDPGSKEKGGEYKFPRGQMVPEFEAAAFSLNTNQISDIVTTQYGYHIIKLSEKIPAKKLELDKVSPKIKDYLRQQAIQKNIKGYLETLKKNAGVEILDEKLKLVESAPASNLPAGQPAVKPAAKP